MTLGELIGFLSEDFSVILVMDPLLVGVERSFNAGGFVID